MCGAGVERDGIWIIQRGKIFSFKPTLRVRRFLALSSIKTKRDSLHHLVVPVLRREVGPMVEPREEDITLSLYHLGTLLYFLILRFYLRFPSKISTISGLKTTPGSAAGPPSSGRRSNLKKNQDKEGATRV